MKSKHLLMPYINLNENVVAFDDFDFTIIGAGAAGILMAVKLHQSGRKVMLIESGHFNIDEERQKLNEVTQSGKYLNNAVWGRKRVIGGTTTAWGGQSLPFSPLDFEARSWVENSGWPIPFDELAPYYLEASEFMKIDSLDYKSEIFKKIRLKDPGFDKDIIDYHVAKWASQPNFKTLYKNFLLNKIPVIYNATLNRINSEGNKVISIDILNFNKKRFTVPIRKLILCARGIETNRILLNNCHLFATSDNINLLGKGFMDHPCIEVGEVNTKRMYDLQRYFNTHVHRKKKYSLRLSLSEQFQRAQKTLNCSASIMFRIPENVFNPYNEMKAFMKDGKIARLLKLGSMLPGITRSAAAFLNKKFYLKFKVIPKIVLMIEQEPLSISRISLSKEKDQFGEYKAHIHWRISRLTWSTVVKSSFVVKEELERLGFGTVSLYSHIKNEEDNWTDLLFDVNHHMGGCRMSNTADCGIVNSDLRLWNIDNLFVCSTAVFPTSSHSNPTSTLLALGARLAKHLIH